MGALSRSSAGPEIHGIMRERVTSAILEPMAALSPGPGAIFRPTVATALITGAGTLRRLYGPGVLGTPGHETMIARLTAVFEACLRM